MSELYKPGNVTGSEWTRAYQIVIDHRRNRPPVATFFEERVLATDTGSVRTSPKGAVALTFDPAALIPVLDPTTGEPTGTTITQGELYALVYSAYLAAATARDAAQEEPDA